MPLSSVVGAQSIIKPGVCTSSTRPAVPFEGQMIYETDTDKVLVYNGTDWKQTPTAATAGAVLQVVQGTYSTQVVSSTNTYVTTGLTATITPSSTSSKVLCIVQQSGCGKESSNTYVLLRLYRGASSIHQIEAYGAFDNTTGINYVGTIGTTYLDSPATVAATTYTTYVASGANSGLVSVQANSGTSTMILMEISA
jgi:hypothetical protein